MIFTLKTFGIARDILGGTKVVIEMNGQSVAELRAHLNSTYPTLENLSSLYIAVNREYAQENQLLNERDEIALIPPVSGG